MRGVKPFLFNEFGAAPQGAEHPVADAADAIATARAEGLSEGRRLAMDSIAADETALLARIADDLEKRRAFYDTEISETRESLIELSRAFIEEFCASLANTREIEAAAEFFRNLVEHSEDRRVARLHLSPASAERLGPKLSDMIAARGLGDFVTLQSDPSLKTGEIRIDWRGGGARRTRAEIAASVETLIQSFNAAQGAQNREAQQ